MTYLGSAPAGAFALAPHDFATALKMLDKSQTASERAAAVEALSRAKLSPDQFTAVAGALRTVAPLELPRLLACSTTRRTKPSVGRLSSASGPGNCGALSASRW